MAGKSAMRGKTEAVPRSTKATKRLSVDDLVAFMSLPIFYELRTAVDVGILLFDDLDEYDLPEGYSKEDIWRILLAVRKQAAVFVPEDPERTADMWMVTTSSLSFNTEMLEVRSKEDSSLARSLRDMQGSPFVTRFIERTLMRGLADEGIAMDEERVHELFAGAPPLTSLDQLVANYFRLSSDCDTVFAARGDPRAHRDAVLRAFRRGRFVRAARAGARAAGSALGASGIPGADGSGVPAGLRGGGRYAFRPRVAAA